MILITKIVLFTAPLIVSDPSLHNKNVFAPLYVPELHNSSLESAIPDLNPKTECNFGASSRLATKKMKHFTYNCSQPTHDWLLIRASEANYNDVLFK